jgi:hypothetical protein
MFWENREGKYITPRTPTLLSRRTNFEAVIIREYGWWVIEWVGVNISHHGIFQNASYFF